MRVRAAGSTTRAARRLFGFFDLVLLHSVLLLEMALPQSSGVRKSPTIARPTDERGS